MRLTPWFAHSGVWAEAGLTATGHAREMRLFCVFFHFFLCVCCLFCLFVFCVFPLCQIGEATQKCVTDARELRFWLDPHIGHRILTFHSQRKKQRISRTRPAHPPRIENAFYTVFDCSFRRMGRGRPDGHRTCLGNALVLSFVCVCFLFCLFFFFFLCVFFPVCQIGELHKNVLQMHGK